MENSTKVITKPNALLMFVALIFAAALTIGYIEITHWLIEIGLISKIAFGAILLLTLVAATLWQAKGAFFKKKRMQTTKDWFILFSAVFIGASMWFNLFVLILDYIF